jgi:predicted PurR-regulated permease PerM
MSFNWRGMTRGRRGRLLLVIALVLLILGLLWAGRAALFPFILALVLAYVLLPLVAFFERALRRLLPRFARGRPVAILLTYLAVVLALLVFILLVLPVVSPQFRALWDNRQEIADAVQKLVSQGLTWYRVNAPADIQAQIDQAAQQAGERLSGTLQAALVETVSAVTGTVAFIASLVIIPEWLFYVLNDQSLFMRKAVAIIPVQVRADTVNIVRISDRILSKYLRGQLVLCVVVGVLAAVGLSVLKVPFPAVLGLIAGIFEILRFVGPLLGALPAVLVALIQDPLLAVWTALLFVVIQQIENTFLVPRISGKAVELHPALIVLVLLIGSEIAGLPGAILAVPLTAIIRDVFKYLYLRLGDNPLDPQLAMSRIADVPMQLDV